MTTGATYLGGMSVGGVVPALPLATASIASLLAPQAAKAADIAVRLASPFVPPNPAALASALASHVANLASILSTLPTADAKARLTMASELGALTAVVGQVRTLLATLSGAASTGGVHVYELEGPTGQLGSMLQSATTGGFPGGAGALGPGWGLFIGTESPSARAALSVVLAHH